MEWSARSVSTSAMRKAARGTKKRQETTRTGNGTARTGAAPVRHLHKKGEGQNGVKEADGEGGGLEEIGEKANE